MTWGWHNYADCNMWEMTQRHKKLAKAQRAYFEWAS